MERYTAANAGAQRRTCRQASKPDQAIEPAKSSKKPELPWQDSAFVTLQQASKIIGVSVASLYRFETEKRLVFRRLAGRTLISTPSLIALVSTAEPWSASSGGSAARAARNAEQAAA